MTTPIDPSIAYLANLITQNASSGPSNMDLAKYVLANSKINYGTDSPVDLTPPKHHIGLLSRVMDILSRPNYAIANTVKSLQDQENPISGFFRGLEGKDKTTFSDVLKNAGVDNNLIRGAAGFGLDIATDPTTYIGGEGALKSLGQKLGIGARALTLPEKPEIALARDATNQAAARAAIPKATTQDQFNLINQVIGNLPNTNQVVKNLPAPSELEQARVADSIANLPRSKARVNTQFPNSVNPSQQLSIWRNILAEAKNIHPSDFTRQFQSAHGMLAHAENELERQGIIPRYWDGTPFKLSDLLTEMNFGDKLKDSNDLTSTLDKELKKVTTRIKNPSVAQSLHNIKVRNAIAYSPEVKNALDNILRDSANAGVDISQNVNLNQLGNAIPSIAERHNLPLKPQEFKATEGQNRLLDRTLEVLPDAREKPKPIPMLSPNERTAVDLTVNRVPSTRAAINTRFPDSVNPNQQLATWKSLFNYAQRKIPGNVQKQFQSAYHMLIHAENSLEVGGKTLRYWDGANFKLSDVIAELLTGKGVKLTQDIMPQVEKELSKVNTRFKNPDVTQAFHNVRVRSAITDSPKIKEALDAIIGEKRNLEEQPLSDARLKQLFKSMPSLAGRHAVDLGVSAAGEQATEDLTRQVIRREAPPVANTANSVREAIDVSSNDFREPINGKGKVEEGIGARIFSWYGQKDLRPIVEQQLMTASNASWLRAAAIKRFSDSFSPAQQLEGIRFAQGIPGVRPSQIGMIYKQTLENLFRGSGLSDSIWRSSTVSGKAELLMERLNKHLEITGAPWRFTSGKIKDPITRLVTDYSGDHNWLKSWQAWDVQDPAIFFPKIQGAVETATHEKAIFDDIAERFGSKVGGNGYTQTIDYPYLHGIHFTKEIADQIPRVIKGMDEFYTAGSKSPFLKTFDKITRAWKFGVTLPSPAHHIRNLIGDAYMSWMAGVNSVKPYNYAMQILRTQRHNYQGINDVEKLVQVGAISKAMGRTPNPKDILFTNKSGHSFTGEQIYIAANQMGILPQAHVIEDILGNEPFIKGFQPFKGKVKAKLEGFSETREHFSRLAHFIDVVSKSTGDDFQSIFRKAGFTVRKWHPDYLTLTPFEKKFLRRIMPFYSWTRRAIPLVIESALLNPGKTLVYPKAMQNLQVAMGINAPSRTDPFPTNQRFPNWIRDLGVGPIFDHPALGARSVTDLFGNNVGATIVNPSNPTFDLGSQFSNPIQGLGELLHPGLKIPAELLTRTQISTGAPINSGNFMEYLGNQLPIFSTVQGLTGITPALGQTNRAQKEGSISTERLMNYITALGVRGTGPYIKQAQIEQGGGGR